MSKSGYSLSEFGGSFETSLKRILNLARLEPVPVEKENEQEKKTREPTADELLKFLKKEEKSEELLEPRALFTHDEHPLKWTCEDSFPLKAHGFIRDWRLGTIGIVHFLEEESSDEIRTLLEQAAYVRHLLQEYGEPESSPMVVEVTLVMLRWDTSTQQISQALRTITETSTFLHTIGVSLLLSLIHI